MISHSNTTTQNTFKTFTALGNHYQYHIEVEGTHYMGLTLDWNYDQGFVDVSMPGYIPKLLNRLQHKSPTRLEYSPRDHYPLVFPKKVNASSYHCPTIPLNYLQSTPKKSNLSLVLYCTMVAPSTIPFYPPLTILPCSKHTQQNTP